VILFCIDCSESMQELRDDPKYEGGVKTSHLLTALEAAMQIQKKKVIVGPNDSVGILLFNTVRTATMLRRSGYSICFRRRIMRQESMGTKSNLIITLFSQSRQ
jgi:hypothetical protein